MAAPPPNAPKAVPLPEGKQVAVTGAFSAMALLSACEVMVLIFTRFRHYQGLYFWAMLVATIGAVLFNIGIVLHFYVPFSQNTLYGIISITMLGYSLYIPAELLVLYSRLHLVLVSPRLLRFVFLVGASEFLLVSFPNGVFAVGAIVSDNAHFRAVYPVWQRIEVCVYTASGIIVSTVYIIQVFRIWKTDFYANTRRVFTNLLWINVFLIFLDGANIAMAFIKNAAPLQTAWVGFLYAFKLKVEFWILNQLTRMSQQERLLRLKDQDIPARPKRSSFQQVFGTLPRRQEIS